MKKQLYFVDAVICLLYSALANWCIINLVLSLGLVLASVFSLVHLSY